MKFTSAKLAILLVGLVFTSPAYADNGASDALDQEGRAHFYIRCNFAYNYFIKKVRHSTTFWVLTPIEGIPPKLEGANFRAKRRWGNRALPLIIEQLRAKKDISIDDRYFVQRCAFKTDHLMRGGREQLQQRMDFDLAKARRRPQTVLIFDDFEMDWSR